MAKAGDVRQAQFVRKVDPNETTENLVDEAKDLNWTRGVEHALITTTTGDRFFVRGGRDAIEFDAQETEEGTTVFCPDASNTSCEVARIDWHTHPVATGPSDDDRKVLRLLGQAVSRVFEVGGEVGGTAFGPPSVEKP